ncbi:hypothetical protein F4777DRAFT_590933 [Nemania sp. FL0916]|nr:hypothetical protein F4777DRAFT_590933 [Nemania sp. FL0916]
MAGSNSSGFRPNVDRHRTASARLSSISEHQKENTPTSEDDGVSMPAQAVRAKTPSLEPVRGPHSHHHARGKSQSSAGSSDISPLQLDVERNEGPWPQATRHPLASSTWRRAPLFESKAPTSQQEALGARPSRPGQHEVVEVQWRIVRWTNAQQESGYIRHSRTLSYTGFDGPRSSIGRISPVHLPSTTPSPPFSSFSLRNCLWPKQKPRKGHDVSESTDPDSSTPKRSLDSPTEAAENKKTKIRSREPERKGNQPQSHNVQNGVFNSCPEFYQRSPPTIQPFVSEQIQNNDFSLGLPSHTQSNIPSSRRQHRYISERVLRRFRYIRDKLYRGRSSSMYSIRPEFPPPPDGKERRYQSRNSNEIWPSSGEESPIFNTPEPTISPAPPGGRHADLLAASGLMMATAELDRLTGSTGNTGNTPRPSTAASPELSRTPAPPSLELPHNMMATDNFRTPPAFSDTSSSLYPPTGLTSPISRSPKRSGRNIRRQHSRLSEVTTPEETDTATQFDFGDATALHVSYPIDRPLQDGQAERGMGLWVPPRSISRLSSSDSQANDDYTLAPMFAPMRPKSPGTTGGPGIILSQPMISRNQSPEQLHDESNAKLSTPNHMGEKSVFVPASTAPLGLDKIVPGKNGSMSCHLDTWSEDQGEPGDSEPFCPPNCLNLGQRGRGFEP